MKSLRFILIISFLFIGFQQTARADIIKVPDDYPTINEAIVAAEDGDEVVVSPGTYFESNIFFQRKAITVRSTGPNNRSIVESTIIDGSRGSGRPVFNLYMEEGPDSVINGFTIKNGGATGEGTHFGGGISCHQSSPTISNNIIENNSAMYGGGIYCYESEAVIINNTIRNNYASQTGGGICYTNSTGEITGNTITNNQSIFYGGGLSLGNGEGFDSPLIDGNVITLNRSNHGAGISCYGAVITNNAIMNNIGVPDGPCALTMGGGIYGTPSVVRGNKVFNNTADWGGGIHITGYTAEISDNIITNNFATLHGGGLDFRLCSEPIVKNNTILNNRSALGAGIFCYTGTFVNNVISRNEGFSEDPETKINGGGIYFADISESNVSQPNLTNNTLDRNTADHGGNIYICPSSPVIKNNIISNAQSGGGIFRDESGAESLQPLISHCNLFQNQGNNYVGINDLTGSSGNISENPLFANDENSDYHLRSAYGRWSGTSWVEDLQTSPCIDRGDPLSDYFLETQPNGSRINMGAYGNTVEASRSNQNKLTIIVYEDAQLVYPLLVKDYPRTMVVKDIKQLAEKLEKEIVHVLFIDISTPKFDRLNKANQINKLKSISKYQDIAIIGYSKKNIKGGMDLCLKAGMDSYVPSPNKKKLIKAIKKGINKTGSLIPIPHLKTLKPKVSK